MWPGRMMAVNRFGKSAFIRFRDRTGQMQAYIRMDQVGGDAYGLFKKLDIGDFVSMDRLAVPNENRRMVPIGNHIASGRQILPGPCQRNFMA